MTQEKNLGGLAAINRELIAKVETIDAPQRGVLDVDSTEIPVYGQLEQSSYNGHFESTCYHPLLMFNGEGDCVAAKLRPGNVHSAEDWDKVLLPEAQPKRNIVLESPERGYIVLGCWEPKRKFRLRTSLTQIVDQRQLRCVDIVRDFRAPFKFSSPIIGARELVPYFLRTPCLTDAGGPPVSPRTGYTDPAMRFISLAQFALALIVVQICCGVAAGQISVQHTEGLLHGFLVLRNSENQSIAHGDLTQTARGNQITSHLVFHFKDGSLHDETTVFSQLWEFRLLRYHLVQKGPSFPRAQELSIDTATGLLSIRSEGDDGKQQLQKEKLKLPGDLANGMVAILLKNIPPDSSSRRVSMLATTPQPRLVNLEISEQGEDVFLFGGESRKASHYIVKIELRGMAGVVAPLVGKKPPDIDVWILRGSAPAFLKSRGPLSAGGPIWEIVLASPSWPTEPENH